MIVKGFLRFKRLLVLLANSSMWFAVTPEPNDTWRIEVKSAERYLLEMYLKELD